MANRHLSRVIIMQSLYEKDFREDSNILNISNRNIAAYQEECDKTYIHESLGEIIQNIKKIDKIISDAAPEWPIDQIAKIDKAILRVAVYELVFSQKIPPKVVINEAVEIAKIYGSENSSKFVNGVLGTLFKKDSRFDKEDISQKIDKEEHEIPEYNDDINLIDLQ